MATLTIACLTVGKTEGVIYHVITDRVPRDSLSSHVTHFHSPAKERKLTLEKESLILEA